MLNTCLLSCFKCSITDQPIGKFNQIKIPRYLTPKHSKKFYISSLFRSLNLLRNIHFNYIPPLHT